MKSLPLPYQAFAVMEKYPIRMAIRPGVELKNDLRLSAANGGFIFQRNIQISSDFIAAYPDSPTRGDRFGGSTVYKNYKTADGNISVHIRELFRRDVNALYDTQQWAYENDIAYARYEMTFYVEKPTFVKNLYLFSRLPLPNGYLSGYTDGSVAVGDSVFTAIEHPMAKVSMIADSTFTWQISGLQNGVKEYPITGAEPNRTLRCVIIPEKGKYNGIKSVELVTSSGAILAASHDQNEYRVKTPEQTNNMKLRVSFNPVTERVIGKVELYGSTICSYFDGYIPFNAELLPGEPVTFIAVVGAEPEPNQMRRSFQNYLNNERAYPNRQFLHYNSWYHLGINRNDNPDPLQRMTEKDALQVMGEFRRELFQKRKVNLNSYLWDDGWDNWDSLWDYHVGFPAAFEKLAKAAAMQNSGIGAWLSPWGGYGQSKAKRLDYARRNNIPISADGFSLADSRYFNAFKLRCSQMIAAYNLNIFKFDGIGNGTWATGANESKTPDIHALLTLCRTLREIKPDLYISTTVGTWASPFWLMYSDCVWRQGEDCHFLGDGNNRERWINYRDNTVYQRFALRAPLFPLCGIMNHGILVGNRGLPAQMPLDASPASTTSFANEVWTFFAFGSSLQELYIDPSLMHEGWWDTLAKAVKWSRENHLALNDAHWIGGNPEKQEIYGVAAWRPGKGIIMLRNPGKTAKSISGNLYQWLELPRIASKTVSKITVPYRSSENIKVPSLTETKQPFNIELPPFGVLVMEFE